MKRIILFALIVTSLTTASVEAQSSVARSATIQATPAVSSSAVQLERETQPPAQTRAASSVTADGVDYQRPAVILVIDVSRSVRRYLRQMRSVAEQACNAAPDNALFSIVAVGSQAEKHLYTQRADAIAFINSLDATSSYSDLGRGTDSALALLQEAQTNRALILYLTDGRVELPNNFQDRADFATILQREFTQRPNVRVHIINVNNQPMAGIDSLPSNVSVYTLASWSEAEAAMRNSLSAEIREQFVTPPPIATPGIQSDEEAPVTSSYGRVLVGVGLLALIALGAIAFFVQRKRRMNNAIADSNSDTPANIMRVEDIKPLEPESAPEPVALLEFKGDNATVSGATMKRTVMKADDKVVIGNSAFETDFAFKNLKQQQSVEIRFDGENLKVFRLRPHVAGMIDDVRLNDEDAPLTFVMNDDDELTVGDLKIRMFFTDESYAETLGVNDTPETTDKTLTLMTDGLPPIVEERRLRRGVSRLNSR